MNYDLTARPSAADVAVVYAGGHQWEVAGRMRRRSTMFLDSKQKGVSRSGLFFYLKHRINY